MKIFITALGVALSLTLVACENAPPEPAAEAEYSLRFVQAPLLLSIIPVYEGIAGKKVIVEQDFEGITMTVNTKQKLTRAEAIRVIEDSLLINGFALLPVDDHTVKLIGAGPIPVG